MNISTHKPVRAALARTGRVVLALTALVAGLLLATGAGASSAVADSVGEGQKVLFATHGYSIGGSAYDATSPRPCLTPSIADDTLRQAACSGFGHWTYIGFGHGGFQLQESAIGHKCLSATSAAAGAGLTLAPCDGQSDRQRWFLSGPADSAVLRLWFHFGLCITASAADGADRLDACGDMRPSGNTSEMQQLTVVWTRAQLVLGVNDLASSGEPTQWTATFDGQDILGEKIRWGLVGHGNQSLQSNLLPGDYTLSVVTDGPDQTYSGKWVQGSATSPNSSPFQTLEVSSVGWGPRALGVHSPGYVRVAVPNDPALAFDTLGTYVHDVDNAPVG